MLDDNRYFNFEFNPQKCMYLGLRTSRNNAFRVLPKSDSIFNVSSLRTSDGWENTYQVPFSFIRMFFKDFVAFPGKKMRANFYKCGEKTIQEHYFSWNPVDSITPDFHRPEFFGELIFG